MWHKGYDKPGISSEGMGSLGCTSIIGRVCIGLKVVLIPSGFSGFLAAETFGCREL